MMVILTAMQTVTLGGTCDGDPDGLMMVNPMATKTVILKGLTRRKQLSPMANQRVHSKAISEGDTEGIRGSCRR
jgi:hypothetical protein